MNTDLVRVLDAIGVRASLATSRASWALCWIIGNPNSRLLKVAYLTLEWKESKSGVPIEFAPKREDLNIPRSYVTSLQLMS